jgi:hypothetical protein
MGYKFSMDIFSILLVVFGLIAFESISSIDNAIINADVLSTMQERFRRIFLTWGLIFGVFAIRFILPWLIIWVATPSLGPIDALLATFSNDPAVAHAIEASAPVLLIGGGVFLVFLFFDWLFLQPKNFGLAGEKFIQRQGVWFFAVVAVILTLVVWLAINRNPIMAFSAVLGSTAFFIVHGFRQNAELREKELMTSSLPDLSKLLYLEIIDATFSIDGVLGAFAFTLSVPLILIGNGIGALIVRQLTVSNIARIKRYVYLKNGAMYSILFLGMFMIIESLGGEMPTWIAPIATFTIIGYFFLKSRNYLKRQPLKEEAPPQPNPAEEGVPSKERST